MTGTGKEATSEFWIIYGVPTMIIPNHKKSTENFSIKSISL